MRQEYPDTLPLAGLSGRRHAMRKSRCQLAAIGKDVDAQARQVDATEHRKGCGIGIARSEQPARIVCKTIKGYTSHLHLKAGNENRKLRIRPALLLHHRPAGGLVDIMDRVDHHQVGQFVVHVDLERFAGCGKTPGQVVRKG